MTRLQHGCPSTQRSGLFWTRTTSEGIRRIVVSARLAELVDVLAPATDLHVDEAAVAGFVAGGLAPDATTLREIRRIPPGWTASWSDVDAEPVLSPPSTDGEAPQCTGPHLVDQYLESFDRAVDRGLDASGGTVCLAMSGGLDSTFVAASLLRRASVDRPVRAFIHVPHPDAGLSPIGNWDPDDLAAARSVEAVADGRLILTPVVNEGLVQPLDAAARSAEATWSPVFNPANTVWIDEMRRRANDLGAALLWNGEHGNAAFSADHPYAMRYHLRRAEFSAARTVWRSHRDEGTGRLRLVRGQLVGPAVRSGQARLAELRERRRPAGFDPLRMPRRVRPMSRSSFVAWLHRDANPLGTLQPEPDLATLFDPFSDAAVIGFAASMTPAEWCRYGSGRGYARRLGLGRVPDDVRLRTRRGGQSWDHWFVIRSQRDRYLDEVRSLVATPILGDLLDAPTRARIEAEVASWPWGEVGVAPTALGSVERLLALAMFVRSTQARLARRR